MVNTYQANTQTLPQKNYSLTKISYVITMLPTREFFKKIECPYYNFPIKGSCNRPHCHFKHSKRDADYDFVEPVVEQIEQNDLVAEDVTPEESEDEIENPPPSMTTNHGLHIQEDVEDEEEEEFVEENEEKEEEFVEENEEKEEFVEENEEIEDEEDNLLSFKKALMNSIKKLLELYPKLFCKNINTKDFNHLVDEFIKNLLNYEELESVVTKKLTYNPTPIVELKKQEKRIKTQLPYIPECVKVNQCVVSDTLDIDSDLKYLEDLIQNDSLFASSNETHETLSEYTEPTKIKQDEKSKTKDNNEESIEISKSSCSPSHNFKSSWKDKSISSKEEKVSSKQKRSSSSKDKHRSSSNSHKHSSSSSKHSSSHSSSRSKHSSSSKRRRSKSSNKDCESKKSKYPSSLHKKSESSTIIISSESSDSDSFDVYNLDNQKDNGENLVVNDNSSPIDEKAEIDGYNEPEYIRKKKKQRIAHVDIFGVPSSPAPVSNRAKVINPNDRFKQIQEKYKGLNRHTQVTQHAPSSLKIAHVPNVPSMITAKKTLTQVPPSPSINKTSLLMNDILKRTELKKTIAQTSKKNNRVAHVPAIGATATKPMIQVDGKGTRIPLVIRQTCLDRIFALYSKYVPPDLASDRAVQVESETYDKCHAAKSYQNSIANSILRIRKEQSGFFLS